MKTVTIDLKTLQHGAFYWDKRYCTLGQILHNEGVPDDNLVMFKEADKRFGAVNRIDIASASDKVSHIVFCKKKRCHCRIQTLADSIRVLREALGHINYRLRVRGYAQARARRAA